ncbi:FkbM family methyltransferase [Bradyrhizobium sp. CB1650]|uniref:FkbM family methyltransferase n=1 Tax=Bradyrhizobium sp. CB1650 TaxID=3039153 RepID=UPI002435F873|nr:FkbM family methyltransferase [Bradyrhizobium sp. CB1650]WGD55355.1 FkbM family methyltransferase [Bradyrhizobium sp. CB1650]
MSWIKNQRLLRRQRDAERAAARLRELIDRQVDISENMIEAVIERDRTKVLDILARTDPFFSQRALSFSQEGEDLILKRLFEGRSEGFFVDVGAYHPFRFSNTFLLYRSGWRGINIDATPGSMHAFEEFRPLDTNIECFVGDPTSEKIFTRYNEPALNTGSQMVLESRVLHSSVYWPVGTSKVRPRSLAAILEEHKPADVSIDLLNLDVEGSEQDVLDSNDWSRYRPSVIVIEQLSTDLEASSHHPTTKFLSDLGYRLVAKAINSSFFKLKEAGSR